MADDNLGFSWKRVGDEIRLGDRLIRVVAIRPGRVKLLAIGPDGVETEAEIASPALTGGDESGKMTPLV